MCRNVAYKIRPRSQDDDGHERRRMHFIVIIGLYIYFEGVGWGQIPPPPPQKKKKG